jgi:hypothetical protein
MKRAVVRLAHVDLATNPARQLTEQLPEVLRTVGSGELGTVLCGGACFLAAAGHADGARRGCFA